MLMSKPFLYDLFSLPLPFEFEPDIKHGNPVISILKEENVIQYSWDLPGVEVDDLSISFERGNAIIEGKRSDRDEKFKFVCSIDKTRDTETAIAELKNGVLKVKFKPKESEKSKTIKILKG